MKLYLDTNSTDYLAPVKLTPWEANFVMFCLGETLSGEKRDFSNVGYKVSPSKVIELIDASWKWEEHIYEINDQDGRWIKCSAGLQRRQAGRKDKLMDKLHGLLGTAETWDATWPIQRKASYLQRILRPMKWIDPGIDVTNGALHCASYHYTFPKENYKTWSGSTWADEAKAWLEKEAV